MSAPRSKSASIFGAIDPSDVAGRPQPYRRHESIFAEGDQPKGIYFLKSGLVKAVKYSPQDRPFTMEIVVPGQFFGMIAALDRHPYPVTAFAIQPSEAFCIPMDDFHRRLKDDPAFSRRIYDQIGAHLRHGQELRSLQKEPVERRIAYVLTLLSESLGSTLPVSREEVADMAGATAETAIRTLAAFRRRGVISTGWKRITLLKPARLAR